MCLKQWTQHLALCGRGSGWRVVGVPWRSAEWKHEYDTSHLCALQSRLPNHRARTGTLHPGKADLIMPFYSVEAEAQGGDSHLPKATQLVCGVGTGSPASQDIGPLASMCWTAPHLVGSLSFSSQLAALLLGVSHDLGAVLTSQLNMETEAGGGLSVHFLLILPLVFTHEICILSPQ